MLSILWDGSLIHFCLHVCFLLYQWLIRLLLVFSHLTFPFGKIFSIHRGFVAPSDIQSFTNEVKSKLSARCQGKTVKCFAQAVKEICVAFDELQKKKLSGFGDELDRSDVGCEAPSVDGVEDDGVEVDLKVDTGDSTDNGEIMNEAISDSGSKLERCSQRRGGTESQDVKPSVSSRANDSLSLLLSPEKSNRIFDGAKPKEEVLMTSSPDNSSYLREVTAVKSVEDICTKTHGEEKKLLANGHKSKKIGAVSKKKCEGALEVHKTSISAVASLKDEIDGRSIDPPEAIERLKDGRACKIDSGSSTREFSSSPHKAESGINSGRKSKELLNTKKRVKVADNMLDSGVDPDELAKGKPSGKEKRAQHGHGKPGANDGLHPAKKSKRQVMGDDATHGSHARRTKSDSPRPNVVDKKALRKPEFKGSTSCVKAESNHASRAQAGIVGSNVSGDEAVLPVTKRRRRAMEAMSDSDTLTTDDKTERKPLLVKNDVSSSNNVGVSGSQLHKKRRAVCLSDDEDELKTPVYGGSARNVNASAFVSDATKSNDAHNDSCKNAQLVGVSIGFEDVHLKESSSELRNDSLSPSEQQTDEKRPEKAVAAHLSHCPGKIYSEHLSSMEQFLSKEQLSSKEAKSTLISPRKSPQSGPTEPVAEQHKVVKPLVNVCGTGPQKKVQVGSAKASVVVSNSINSSQNQATIKRNRPSSGERSKTTPKSISRFGESTVLTENSVEYNSLPSERCAHF
jgi:hypothetical protein